ncbi:sulfotransferase 1A1-like [Glandiceps talaboti]
MAASNQNVEGDTCDFFYHKGYCYTSDLDRNAVESMKDFPYKDGDVLVAGFQKSGNHWLVQILIKMYEDWGLCTHDDQRDASGLDWLMFAPQLQTVRQGWKTAFEEQMDSMPSPRLLRAHFPLEVLSPEKHLREKRLKVICISRNPKDVCVSWYHYMKVFAAGRWAQSFDKVLTNFVEGQTINGPWLNHVSSWHTLDCSDNVLHVKYEDMRQNPKLVIRRISEFLNRPLTDEKLEAVAESTTFETMKSAGSDRKIPMTREVKNFLRKGMIGDWKTHFTVAQNEYFDREITQKLTERGINFIYE